MRKNEYLVIFYLFLVWRIFLIASFFIGQSLFENQQNFLGGGIDNYLSNPFFWSHGNFDGEHYLSISLFGYKPLQYFYFPLFPLLINVLSPVANITSHLATGILISNITFYVGLVGFWKLLRLDFKQKQVFKIVLLLLLFPTSFYFAISYTESLFFVFLVWSFYFARKERWVLAALLGSFTSATRIIGLSLAPAYAYTLYKSSKSKINLTIKLIIISFISTGFLLFVYYLYTKTGDPLAFNEGSEAFGEYRSQTPLPLPQVFYRYIFKIIPALSWGYFPVVLTTLLEFFTGTLATLAIIYGFFKTRTDYWIYMLFGFLMPTLYNGFVSLPRYILVLFPFFIVMSILLNKLSQKVNYTIYAFSAILLFFSYILFSKGYWIA